MGRALKWFRTFQLLQYAPLHNRDKFLKLPGMLCFDVSFALAQGVTYLVLYMSTNFIKHADEKAIWEGKPDCKPFMMKTLVEFFGYILFLAFSWGLFITISMVGKGELNWKMMYLIAFLTIGGGLFRAGHRVLNYSKTLYWVTNRMIYIQSGIFTRKRIAFARNKTNRRRQRRKAVPKIRIHKRSSQYYKIASLN